MASGQKLSPGLPGGRMDCRLRLVRLAGGSFPGRPLAAGIRASLLTLAVLYLVSALALRPHERSKRGDELERDSNRGG